VTKKGSEGDVFGQPPVSVAVVENTIAPGGASSSELLGYD
jgi:hypothetical protein